MSEGPLKSGEDADKTEETMPTVEGLPAVDNICDTVNDLPACADKGATQVGLPAFMVKDPGLTSTLLQYGRPIDDLCDSPSMNDTLPMGSGGNFADTQPMTQRSSIMARYSGLVSGQPETDLPEELKALVLANFENPGVKALCEKAAEKNLALMIARDLSEPYMSDYLGALEAAIDNLPELIMRKARSPIPMIIGQIKEKNTKGMANVKDSQVGVRMAVTQMFDKVPDLRETLSTVDTKREINAEAVQETFVHEISHKLSFQHDHDGKLLFPREDWLDLMRANGVEYLIVMNERQKEMMRLGHTMSVPPTDIEDLPEDPDEFLEALKSQLRSHVTYASDPVELVAFSAQNEDLSLNDPKGYNYNDEHDLVGSREILSRNMFCEALPASGDNIYRIWEFDGKKWQSSFIEK